MSAGVKLAQRGESCAQGKLNGNEKLILSDNRKREFAVFIYSECDSSSFAWGTLAELAYAKGRPAPVWTRHVMLVSARVGARPNSTTIRAIGIR